MNQLKLSKWLKVITIGVGIAGILVYFVILPELGRTWVIGNPDYSYCFWPWMIFLWTTGVFCYIALFDFWKICNEIQKDNSFSEENATLLMHISRLAVLDSVIFFVGNTAFLFLGMNHIGLFLLSFFVEFAGVGIAVASAALSHLVFKACNLKQENELTI